MPPVTLAPAPAYAHGWGLLSAAAPASAASAVCSSDGGSSFCVTGDGGDGYFFSWRVSSLCGIGIATGDGGDFFPWMRLPLRDGTGIGGVSDFFPRGGSLPAGGLFPQRHRQRGRRRQRLLPVAGVPL